MESKFFRALLRMLWIISLDRSYKISGVALFRSGSFRRLELLEDDLSLCRVRPLFLLQTLRLVLSVPAGASWVSRWVGVLGFTIRVRFVLSIGLRFLCWFSGSFWLLVERWFCRSFPVPNGATRPLLGYHKP
ncbi:hypothetical protein HID58_044537 [Brassica napus]|uniref:Uncharacterized protein n=1 Tax=Brassica napus TaxID=3708 RepID=A0ABQ8BJN0_BRANA|nr:hypothetical protein HID58_044537 [Brassica napus]